jgi:hypothetical protein
MTTTRLPRFRRHRRRVTAALLTTGVLVPALLTGCSSSPPSTSGTTAAASSDAARVGQCVRDRGYDVDDSDFSSPGRYPAPEGLSPDRLEEYDRAVGECAAGTSLAAPSADGATAPEFERQLLALTACLRDAGYPDVADPVDGVWFPDPDRQDDAAYQAASDACGEQVGLRSAN